MFTLHNSYWLFEIGVHVNTCILDVVPKHVLVWCTVIFVLIIKPSCKTKFCAKSLFVGQPTMTHSLGAMSDIGRENDYYYGCWLN